jgi:hypothetical protein
MELAGVSFYSPGSVDPRTGPVELDFAQLLTLDSLVSSPPQSLSHDLRIVRWLNRFINIEQTIRGKRRV